MASSRRTHGIGAAFGLALLAVLAFPSLASATFHEMKIREASAGGAGGNSSYVELQMYSQGQNLVNGHQLLVFDADGLDGITPGPVATCTIAGNVPNGQSQNTVLIGDSGVAEADKICPALELDAQASAGAVCFEAIDCASWGAFTGDASLPSPAGTPFSAPLPATTSIKRTTTRACPTLLEVADDANNSAADFSAAPRNPTPNSAPPVERICPPLKIRELFAGDLTDASSDFIELQMTAAGQHLIDGQRLVLYDSGGIAVHTFQLPDDVLGGTQRSILIGTDGTATRFGVTPDFVDNGLVLDSASAACISNVDCVAWGGFSGALPSPAGTPEPAFPASQSLVRSISRGCSTAVDSSDDTNSSNADFGAGAPTPRNNSASPIDSACPNTLLTGTPKNRSRDRKPTWRLASSLAGASFQCKLDSRPYSSCDSPFSRRVKPGKHILRVRARTATSGFDPAPALDHFRVLPKRR